MANSSEPARVRPRKSLLDNAARAILSRLDELLAFEPYVAQEDAVTELHEMRIAAKRLRYTLEIFQEAYDRYSPYGAVYREMIEVVRTLQEQLGDLHDADVLVPELAAQIVLLIMAGKEAGQDTEWAPGVHHVDFEACQGLLTLCRESRSVRDRRYAEFVAHWQRLQAEQRFAALRELLDTCRSNENRAKIPALPGQRAKGEQTEDVTDER